MYCVSCVWARPPDRLDFRQTGFRQRIRSRCFRAPVGHSWITRKWMTKRERGEDCVPATPQLAHEQQFLPIPALISPRTGRNCFKSCSMNWSSFFRSNYVQSTYNCVLAHRSLETRRSFSFCCLLNICKTSKILGGYLKHILGFGSLTAWA